MTVSMLPLRDYQRAAIDAFWAALRRGLRRPAIVMPTGTGKTVTYAWLIKEWLEAYPGTRVIMLAHREELLDQGRAKLHDIAPDITGGVVAARRNETLAHVVFGSVQTLRIENRRRQVRNVSLIIVDEAHHAPAASYRAVLEHYPDATVLGVTATFTRGDGVGLRTVWQEVVYDYSIHEAIARGYLVRPRGIRVLVDTLDLSKVRKQAGDISERDAGAAIEASLAPEAVAKAVSEHAHDRPGVLFAPTVRSATLFSEALNEAGFRAAVGHGEMSKDERRSFMSRINSGDIQIACNCGIYTEGTDVPKWSVAIIARPTLHEGLYLQMAGRILRPDHPSGKQDALILDVVGASQRHSLLGAIDLFGKELVIEEEEEEGNERAHFEACQPDLGELCAPCQCWCHSVLTPSAEDDEDDPGYNGPLAYEEVDLFHGSKSLWLSTYAGIRFLPASAERLIVIMPGQIENTWDVASIHAKRPNFGSRWIKQGISDLAYAMAYAEADMDHSERMTAARNRPWRKTAPSFKQLRQAHGMGINVTPQMTKGELWGLIEIRLASARIDSLLPDYVRRALWPTSFNS